MSETDENKPGELLLWLDVETSGLDLERDCLLEAGMILTDLAGVEVGRFQTVVKPVGGISVHDGNMRAIAMHCGNNLLAESLNADPAMCDLQTVDVRAASWMKRNIAWDDDGHAGHVHVAGTNPEFDLAWLRRLGTTSRLLDATSYRRLSMTTFRLMLKAIGRNPYQGRAGSHRVIDCLTRDIAEYRAALELIGKAASHDGAE